MRHVGWRSTVSVNATQKWRSDGNPAEVSDSPTACRALEVNPQWSTRESLPGCVYDMARGYVLAALMVPVVAICGCTSRNRSRESRAS